MYDSREHAPTTSGFEITPRGGSGDVAATGAGGEERYGERAFGVAGAAPRAPHCARIVSYHLKAEVPPPSACPRRLAQASLLFRNGCPTAHPLEYLTYKKGKWMAVRRLSSKEPASKFGNRDTWSICRTDLGH